MGQSSSQPAATQPQQQMQETDTPMDGAVSQDGSEIEVTRKLSAKKAPARSKKRARSPKEEQDQRPAKRNKVKSNNEQSAGAAPMSRKSVPQHRRGTHIQPSQEAEVSKEKSNPAIGDNTAQISANPADQLREELETTQRTESAGGASVETIEEFFESQLPAVAEVAEEEKQNGGAKSAFVQEDGLTDSAMSQGGPRRRKKNILPAEESARKQTRQSPRKKRNQNTQAGAADGAHDNSTSSQRKRYDDGRLLLGTSPIPKDPEEREARFRSKYVQADADEELAELYGNKRAEEDNELEEDGPAQPEQATTNARVEEVKKSSGTSGMKASPIGRPGPPRRKKQQRQSARLDGQAVTGAEDQTATRDQPNTTPPGDATFTIIDVGPPRGLDLIPTPPESPEEEQAAEEQPMVRDHVDEWMEQAIPDEEGAEQATAEVAAEQVRDDAGYLRGYDPDTMAPSTRQEGRINTWLNSQDQTPAPPNLPPSVLGSPVQEKQPNNKRQSSKKKKKKQLSKETVDDSDEYQAKSDAAETDSDLDQAADWQHLLKLRGNPQEKTKENPNIEQKPTPEQEASPEESEHDNTRRGEVQGAWSDAEKATADGIFHSTVRDYNWDENEIRLTFSDKWTNVNEELRLDLQDAFPLRTLAAVRKFCKRRFALREKGKWTGNQDQMLREEHTKQPNEWSKISKAIGKSADDCKDRWRNIVEFKATQVQGPWSAAEEKKLRNAVGQLKDEIRESVQVAEILNDEQRIESMISWEEVATAMGNTRTAKRCREKWQQVINDGGVTSAFSGDEVKLSKRQRKASRDFDKLAGADFGDILREIVDAIFGPGGRADKHYQHESTFWSVVAVRLPNSRFSSALRRYAYNQALKAWEDDPRLKAESTMARKAKILKMKFEEMTEAGEDPIVSVKNYACDRAQEGATGRTANARAKQVKKSKALNAKFKSEEQVVEDDDGTASQVSEAQAHPAEAVEPEISETQEQQRDEHREMEVMDDLPISSVNGRYEASVRSDTPYLTTDDFMARCRAAGRQQHRRYIASQHIDNRGRISST